MGNPQTPSKSSNTTRRVFACVCACVLWVWLMRQLNRPSWQQLGYFWEPLQLFVELGQYHLMVSTVRHSNIQKYLVRPQFPTHNTLCLCWLSQQFLFQSTQPLRMAPVTDSGVYLQVLFVSFLFHMCHKHVLLWSHYVLTVLYACFADVYLCAVLICSLGLLSIFLFTLILTCQYFHRRHRHKGNTLIWFPVNSKL